MHGREGEPGAALKEHLLDSTERLLATRSPDRLTARQIARAADVSDGVLYNYFADKDALVVDAMVRRFAELLARLVEAVPEPGSCSLEDNLGSLAAAALDLHLETLPLLSGLLSDPDLLKRFLVEIHRAHVGAVEIVLSIERYLDAEQAAGRVGDVDTRAAADLLVGAVVVLALTTALGVSRTEVAERLPGIVATLIRGLERVA